jgi:hypothetical protein
MCYSVESSAKTASISLIAIIILLQSNHPYFKWIAILLIGWCGMQGAELLLWLTNPRKSCTPMNKFLTLTLIPLVLLCQLLCPIFGSFFVKSWANCSYNRKLFIIGYCAIISFSFLTYFYTDPEKYCTIVTPQGHLHWWLCKFKPVNSIDYIIKYYLWLFLLFLPVFLLWDISYKAIFAIAIIPLFGFFSGLKTDSSASIWCHYTSFTAFISLFIYALYKFKIYNILK